ncbi:hypothetical protein [Thiolapillus sp.]
MKQVFDDSIDYREEWRKCRKSIKGAPEILAGVQVTEVCNGHMQNRMGQKQTRRTCP